jgi:hypothetical protein
MNDVEGIIKMTSRKAFADENTDKWFEVTGIYAFNEIFTGNDEFLPAYGTLIIFFGFVFYSSLDLKKSEHFQ